MWRFSKEFLKIQQQEAVLRKAVLWRGSSQNANNDWIRSEFLFHTEVLLENWDLLISKKKKKNRKKNLQRTKTRWIFSVCCWVSKPEVWSVSGGGAALCTWHEMWGQSVQPVQQTTTTATERPWQEQRDRDRAAGREARREEGGGHVTANLLKTNLCRRRKVKEKTTLAEHP